MRWGSKENKREAIGDWGMSPIADTSSAVIKRGRNLATQAIYRSTKNVCNHSNRLPILYFQSKTMCWRIVVNSGEYDGTCEMLKEGEGGRGREGGREGGKRGGIATH